MHNGERLGIDHLKVLAKRLKTEAEYLYRYGDITFDKQFLKMHPADRLILLYIALSEGDRDIKAVADKLRLYVNVKFSDIEELQSLISDDDLKRLSVTRNQGEDKIKPDTNDTERIMKELRKACKVMGYLEVEDAYWVIISPDCEKEATWVEASAYHKGNMKLLFSDHVYFNIDEAEQYRLIERMKEGAYILHLHNHPAGNSILPSVNGQYKIGINGHEKSPTCNWQCR